MRKSRTLPHTPLCPDSQGCHALLGLPSGLHRLVFKLVFRLTQACLQACLQAYTGLPSSLSSGLHVCLTSRCAGDHSNSIFSLLPQALVYPASGINANLQWCGQGFSQLPNGVGFGGQVGNYGVWLDASFDTGMSRPVATYGR